MHKEIDCNNCKHLNIIEFEQVDKKQNHICNKYKMRCFHNIVSLYRGKHNPKIYPCGKCKDDKYKEFIKR